MTSSLSLSLSPLSLSLSLCIYILVAKYVHASLARPLPQLVNWLWHILRRLSQFSDLPFDVVDELAACPIQRAQSSSESELSHCCLRVELGVWVSRHAFQMLAEDGNYCMVPRVNGVLFVGAWLYTVMLFELSQYLFLPSPLLLLSSPPPPPPPRHFFSFPPSPSYFFLLRLCLLPPHPKLLFSSSFFFFQMTGAIFLSKGSREQTAVRAEREWNSRDCSINKKWYDSASFILNPIGMNYPAKRSAGVIEPQWLERLDPHASLETFRL